jgi:hypothetical protein
MRGMLGDPLYHSALDRRRFLLTSLAGVVAAPPHRLAASGGLGSCSRQIPAGRAIPDVVGPISRRSVKGFAIWDTWKDAT